MAERSVFVLGGAQTDFARSWSREGTTIADALGEVVGGAIEASQIAASDIDGFEVGNFVAELFTGQGHLGGIMASVHPALAEVSGSRHEAACASGSMAMLTAMARIEAGWNDVILVAGVEQMRNVDSQTAAEHLGAALWVGEESTDAVFPWPHQFALIADAYADRYGLEHQHLAAISRKNIDNARRNPHAQTRTWAFEPDAFGEDDGLNPLVEGRLRRQDCGRITDGAAAVILASDRFLASHRSVQAPRIAGWGHRTAPMRLDTKLANSTDDLMFPHLADAVETARQRAGMTLDDIDVIETHDCFSISEYVAYDHLGITAPGEAWRAVEDGRTSLDGAIPVNPSGGLIGAGHPVGATGVRMVLDAASQVAGNAGEMQVDGATTAQTLNIGGSTTTVASFVLSA